MIIYPRKSKSELTGHRLIAPLAPWVAVTSQFPIMHLGSNSMQLLQQVPQQRPQHMGEGAEVALSLLGCMQIWGRK